MFAVEKIDDRLGRTIIEVVTNESGSDKERKPLNMVNCKDLIDKKDGTNLSNNDKMNLKNMLSGRKSSNFLCPKDLDEIILEGDFGDQVFRYAKISIEGCNEEELDCLPSKDLNGVYFNFVML